MWTDGVTAFLMALWSFPLLVCFIHFQVNTARNTASPAVYLPLFFWGFTLFLCNLAVIVFWLFTTDEEATKAARLANTVGIFIIYFYLVRHLLQEDTSAQLRSSLYEQHREALDRFPEYIPDIDTRLQAVLKDSAFPPSLRPHVEKAVRTYLETNGAISKSALLERMAGSGNPQYELEYALANQLYSDKQLSQLSMDMERVSRSVPRLLAYSSSGVPLWRYAEGMHYLPKALGEAIKDIPVMLTMPDNLPTLHRQVVAASGHGKTKLLESMILDDLDKDGAIVVIDSQNRMINDLAQVVPMDRLVLVDPEHCPPALNIFDNAAKDEKSVSDALQTYEYIFSALDLEMTPLQGMLYRYYSRLCMVVPGANIATMCDMLASPEALHQYAQYIPPLGKPAETFFSKVMEPKTKYAERAHEVNNRLLALLEKPTMMRMLGTRKNKLDFSSLIDQGKVVLISTHKPLLKADAKLLGRVFLSQVLQVALARPEGSKIVRVYVDEFKDYTEDSDILRDIFTDTRKFGLSMNIFHQSLSQLTPKLRVDISTNAATKIAGRVPEDYRELAGQMDVEPEQLKAQQQPGQWTAWFSGYGSYHWPVDPGRLSRMPKVNSLDHVRQVMRQRYGDGQPPAQPAQPTMRYPQSISEPGMYIVQGANKGQLLKDTDEESSPW